MDTRTDEIAGGILRLSTYVPDVAPPDGFTFNQFLIIAEEPLLFHCGPRSLLPLVSRSEEHTSELQSLMRISYAVFCLKKKNIIQTTQHRIIDEQQQLYSNQSEM